MKALIIEDEYPNALRLQKLLNYVDKNIEVVDVLDSVSTSVKFLNNRKDIELLFLDIQLIDGTGLDILPQLNVNIPVIFTTAYDQYAIEAFKYLSVDYLLKPIKEEALKNALIKFKKWYKQHPKTSVSINRQLLENTNVNTLLEILQPSTYRQTYICRRGKNRYPVAIQDIAYFFAEDRETWVMTLAGKEFLLAQTLEQVLPQLDPDIFFRANRKVICANHAIEKYEMIEKSKARLSLNPQPDFEVIVSSERSSLFKQWIGEK